MLVSIAAIVLTVAGSGGAGAAVSGTDQAPSTPTPTTEQEPGTATRYVSNPPDNPGDQAYCNLQADRANAMADSDPTSAKWIVESANSNGCKIVEA